MNIETAIPNTTRYVMQLAYNGENYHGWQVQPNAASVQEVLTRGISVLTRQANIDLVGAGRTDTGVHASFYVAHFDLEAPLANPNDFAYKLNRFLPRDINVVQVFETDTDFHARFGAISRTYHYFISSQKQPFFDRFSARIPAELNIEKMNQAAAKLLEFTDFTSFSKLHTDVKTNNCNLMKAEWTERGNLLVFEIQANRFLRNMVRAVVGTLLEVGKGKLNIEGLVRIVESKNRSEAGTSVPACGLFLSDIEYPEPINSRFDRKNTAI